MKFFKKIKNFFVDDRHEEDEYYEDEYYEEDEIDEKVERRGQEYPAPISQATSQKEKSKFRFPLIDDEQEVQERDHTYEETAKPQKKSAVFYDVEQASGVKLPSHLPQQSLVYDVEVSNIAELLAKRNKSHGNRSIVRYDQAPLRPRSKGPVTSAERQFLTANPQREDVVTPVVNREPTVMPSRKRFVPTEVPSPVHGFNKPKPIEELLPNLEEMQQEAKRASVERTEANPITAIEVEQQNEQVEAMEFVSMTQAEQLQKLSSETVDNVPIEEQTPEQPINFIDQKEETIEVNEQVQQSEQQLEAVLDEPIQEQSLDMQEAIVNSEQRLQDLAVQHLTIENSTVHIEQLRVEQPAPVVQPTIHIDANQAPATTQEEEVKPLSQEDEQQSNQLDEQLVFNEAEVKDEPERSSKGSRLPFNVIMLDSDKKKLQKPLAAYGAKPTFPITDWKGNVISTDVQEKSTEQLQHEVNATEEQPIVEKEEKNNDHNQGGLPFLSNAAIPLEVAADLQPSAPQVEAAIATLVKEEEMAPLTEPAHTDDSNTSQAYEEPAVEMASLEDGELQAPSVEENVQQQIVDNELVETEQLVSEDAVDEIAPKQAVEKAEEVPSVSTSKADSKEMPVDIAATPIVNKVEAPNVEPPAEPMEPTSLFEAYEKPPMDFLLPAEERTEDWAWLDEQAEYLIAALASHQVQAEIAAIEQGPAVTQFEITVAQGTKVSKVRNLSDDIKLALAAKDIRIDAPIPGKRTIGIEIPNRVARAVRLSEVTNSERFIESESPLEAALGLDLSGKPVTLDLRKMPHGLIAGATGSGKSVCINSILVSLLYKANPNDLKLMLIDPKMVELAPFNKIPHLVSPVITDVKAATAALKWAVEEMERRYQLFMHAGVRDLTRYNQQAENARQFAQKLPYILIVIDELADLMMMAPADVEEAICRIAQKARACGIHLIVATQRPSVDVITGLIKSNIPTRIAFAVSSAIDSRTILDTQGAERLLGRGDMLYLGNGMQAPIRLQGTFVTDDEIEDIIAYVRNQGEPNYLFAQEDLIKRTEMFEEQDELFEEVCRFVYEQGTASTSSVQRHFHIGYNRAARLIDMLEKKGFVSEARGSKPRDVYMNESDLDELFG